MENRKILVVDDKPKRIKLSEVKLAPEIYIIEGALSGQEAPLRIKAGIPDLILLDVVMPGMNGCQLCEKIRLDPFIPYVPIIFVCQYDR